MLKQYRNEAILSLLFIAHTIIFTLAGVIAFENMRIVGVDPVCYYSYLRSVVFDGDLDFENEYRALDTGGTLFSYALTQRGRRPNGFSAGPAIVCAPLFLGAHVYVRLTDAAAADGFSPPYQVSCFMTMALFALGGLVLLYRWLRLFFDPKAAFWAAALCWFASPAVYYAWPAAFMPHSISAFFVLLFLYYVQRTRGILDARRWAMVGALAGAMSLMRWQNSLFALYFLPDFLKWQKRPSPRPLLAALACALGIFSPQIIVWWKLYGRLFTVPQGGGFLLWARPMIGSILFSTFNGLFSWTPITLIGVFGVICWMRNREAAPTPQLLFAMFFLQLYVNSAVRDWHGSLGFGMRRFVECVPIFAAGIAAALQTPRLRRRQTLAVAFLALFAVWNYLFLIQYYVHLVAWNRPLTFHEMVGDKLHLPVSIERRRLVRTARLSAQQGYFDDVEKALSLAIRIDPLHTDIYFAGGDIAASQGADDTAWQFYRRVREIAPEDKDFYRAVKRLRARQQQKKVAP